MVLSRSRNLTLALFDWLIRWNRIYVVQSIHLCLLHLLEHYIVWANWLRWYYLILNLSLRLAHLQTDWVVLNCFQWLGVLTRLYNIRIHLLRKVTFKMLCLRWFLVFDFQLSINWSALFALPITLSCSLVLCNSTVASMAHRLATLPLGRGLSEVRCLTCSTAILGKLHRTTSEEQVSMLLKNLCLENWVCFSSFVLGSRFLTRLWPLS